jgi:hypothetical protein
MIIIEDDFLTIAETQSLISYFENNEDKWRSWNGGYKLEFDATFAELGQMINSYIYPKFEARIHWGSIVRWSTHTSQPLHIDCDSGNAPTVLTSIMYLNDTFKGGQTYLEDGTIFAPKRRRALFFDGATIKHGVKEITEGIRYTLGLWYRDINFKE